MMKLYIKLQGLQQAEILNLRSITPTIMWTQLQMVRHLVLGNIKLPSTNSEVCDDVG